MLHIAALMQKLKKELWKYDSTKKLQKIQEIGLKCIILFILVIHVHGSRPIFIKLYTIQKPITLKHINDLRKYTLQSVSATQHNTMQ